MAGDWISVNDSPQPVLVVKPVLVVNDLKHALEVTRAVSPDRSAAADAS